MTSMRRRLQDITDKGVWNARAGSFLVKVRATRAIWFPPQGPEAAKTAGAATKKTASRTTKKATKKSTTAAKKPSGASKAKGVATKASASQKKA